MKDLRAIEPWLAGYLARLAPGERLKVTRAIARALRQSNARRVRDNVQPDGTPMPPRRSQRDRRGRIRKRKGRMFPKIELVRNTAMRVRPDELEIGFKPRVAQTAAENHFGGEALVDRRIPNSIRTRYAARRLLGISPDDRDLIMERALQSIER